MIQFLSVNAAGRLLVCCPQKHVVLQVQAQVLADLVKLGACIDWLTLVQNKVLQKVCCT